MMRHVTVHRGPLAFFTVLTCVLLLALGAVHSTQYLDMTRLVTHHEAFTVQPTTTLETRLPPETQIPRSITEKLDSLHALPGINAAQQIVPSGTDDPFLTITISVDPADLTVHSVQTLHSELRGLSTVIEESGLGDRGISASGELASAVDRVSEDISVMRSVSLLATITVTGLALTILAGAIVTYVASRRELVALYHARGATLGQKMRLTLPVPVAGVALACAIYGGVVTVVPATTGVVNSFPVWGTTAGALLAWTVTVAAVSSVLTHGAKTPVQGPVRHRSLARQMVIALMAVSSLVAMWRLLSQRFDITTVVAPTVLMVCVAVLCAAIVTSLARTVRGRVASPSQFLALRQLGFPSITGFTMAVTTAVGVQFVVVMMVVSSATYQAEVTHVAHEYPADVRATFGQDSQALKSPRVSTVNDGTRHAPAVLAVTEMTGRLGQVDAGVTALPWNTAPTVIASGDITTALTGDDATKNVTAARQWPVGSDQVTVTVEADVVGIAPTHVDVSLSVWLMNDAGDIRVVTDQWAATTRRDGQSATWTFTDSAPHVAGAWYVVGARVSPTSTVQSLGQGMGEMSLQADSSVVEPALDDVVVSLRTEQASVRMMTEPSLALENELSGGSVSSVAVVLNAVTSQRLNVSVGDAVQLDVAGARLDATIADIASPDSAQTHDVFVDSLSAASALIEAGSVPRLPTAHWLTAVSPDQETSVSPQDRYREAVALRDEMTRKAPDIYSPSAIRVRPATTGLFPELTLLCASIVVVVLAITLLGGGWMLEARTRHGDVVAARASRVPGHIVRNAHWRAFGVRLVGVAVPALVAGLALGWLTVPVVLAGLGWSR